MAPASHRAAGAAAGWLLATSIALAQTPAGELYFSFTETHPSCALATPWTAEELAALQAQLAVYYPFAKAVYGNPFDVRTIDVCKFPLPGDVSGTFGGTVIRLENARPTPFVHEMLHGFRDSMLALGIFEEGMVEAGTVIATSRACADVDCSAPPFDAIRLFHGGASQVYYEAQNAPAMFSPAGLFPGNGTFNTHYRQAGYAWAKVEIEHPGFLRAFNERYFVASAADPAVRFFLPALVGIARELAPTVEGVAFEDWFAAQHVFDATATPGPGLAQLRDVRSNFVPPDQYLTVFLWRADRSSAPGVTLEWTVYDDAEQPIATGTDVTDGDGRVVVRFPDGYTGSARLAVSGGGASASQFWPIASSPQGVFGVIPHASGGTVTVGLDADGAPTVAVPVAVGYFTAPTLGPTAGRFRLTYTAPGGGSATRVFTKDASRYFVLLKLPDLTARGAAVAPATLVPGDAFPVSAEVSSAGDVDAPASQVRFFLSTSGSRGPGEVLVGNSPLPALAVGAATTASATAVVPPGTPPGAYRVIACANDPELFAETTTANDCAASVAAVQVVPPYEAAVQPPIRPDGTSVFKARRGSLPVKFTLSAGGARTCALPPATIEVSRFGTGGADAIPDELFQLASDGGAQFRTSDCQYVYNLAAAALGPGEYAVSIRVMGSIVGSATFTLR
jgi:CARDB protein